MSYIDQRAWVLGTPQIGEDTWIGAFCVIDAKHDNLTIGKGCNISCGAQIYTHSTRARCVTEGKEPLDYRPTWIGDYVFVGANAVILAGCVIHSHATIGAGAVLPQDTVVSPGATYVGVPARRLVT